ncbi:MAG: hypothetical protein PVH24_02180 [Candidatus Zixiibacteriota bacterium]
MRRRNRITGSESGGGPRKTNRHCMVMARPVLNLRTVATMLAITVVIGMGLRGSVQARQVELTVFGGGILGGKSSARDGTLNVLDGFSYGATLGMYLAGPAPKSPQLEFYYKRQDSELEFKDRQTGNKSILSDISTEYMMLGILRPISSGNALVYGVGSIGAVRFSPKSSQYDDEWLFAVAAGLGAKVLSRSGPLGFRFDARVLLPIDWGSGYIFCGGGGCSTGLGGGIVLLQIDLSGGIVIAF